MENVMTVWEVFERSKDVFPKKEALVFVGADGKELKLTYNILAGDSEFTAHSLKSYRVEAGQRICLHMPNSPEFISAYLAASKLGATSVLLNPALPQDRVEKILKDTAAKIIVKRIGNEIDIKDLNPPLEPLTPETAAILYSSGTTGEQKGVELTHGNIYNNIKYTSVLTGMTPDDRLICFLPLTHCFGLNFIMGACFYTGATLVLHEKFDLERVLDSLVKNRVTMFFGTPAIYNMILKQKIDPFYFSSVRYFFYAADTLSVNSIKAWEQEYGRKIYTGWGLTETSPFATSNHEAIYKLGSVGKAIPGVEVQIVNENGRILRMESARQNPKNFYGEVFVRGHNVMKGYWNQPEETAKAMDEDGWFRTGDIGYIDHEGYLFIVDRLKDMINVGGEKAWPAEIEKIILQHPDVADTAVVGMPHKIMCAVPKAFVVTKDPALTKKELQEFIKPKLMKHEFPREIEFVEKLPRNQSGKILRRELRDKK